MTDRNGRADELAEAEDERAAVWRLLGRLDARERAILTFRFGLEGDVLTHKEIGRRLGLSREWVRRSRSAPSASSARLSTREARVPARQSVAREPVHRVRGAGGLTLADRVIIRNRRAG